MQKNAPSRQVVMQKNAPSRQVVMQKNAPSRQVVMQKNALWVIMQKNGVKMQKNDAKKNHKNYTSCFLFQAERR